MEHLILDNACLLPPEIHLLADTTYLKTLDVTNCDMEFGGDNPYDEIEGALKVLAGRVPNLQSVTFDGSFCAHPDAEGGQSELRSAVSLGTGSLEFTGGRQLRRSDGGLWLRAWRTALEKARVGIWGQFDGALHGGGNIQPSHPFHC